LRLSSCTVAYPRPINLPWRAACRGDIGSLVPKPYSSPRLRLPKTLVTTRIVILAEASSDSI
jgi:hypothetical protein